jgi:hypothetical protein
MLTKCNGFADGVAKFISATELPAAPANAVAQSRVADAAQLSFPSV